MSGDRALPTGWAEGVIGDLLGREGLFVDGDWIETKDQDPNGDVRLIQLADIGDGEFLSKSARFLTEKRARELNATFLSAGDVLVARMPDPLGRAAIFPGDKTKAITAVDICVVRPQKGDTSNRWLMHAINSPQFRVKVAALQSGSTRKRISRGNLATISLRIPPNKEQERIAAKCDELLSDLDGGVAALQRARERLKVYRAAVLKAAVEGRQTEKWRAAHPDVEPAEKLIERILAERRKKWEEAQLAKYAEKGQSPPKGWKDKYPEPVRPDVVALPPLPEGWCWATIDQVKIEGPQNGLYLPQEKYADHGVPILRIDDYQNFWSRSALEMRKVRAPEEELKSYGLRERDLIINRVNSPSHLGKCLVISSRHIPAVFESNMMRIELSTFVDPSFVASSLRTVEGKARLTRSAKWAVNQASINQQDVCLTAVPVPPLEEQRVAAQVIDEQLSAFDQVAEALEETAVHSAHLRQAILKRAFEGKLLPQDPRDEPASELLARIRAEREAVGGGGSKTRKTGRQKRSTTA